MLFHSAPFALFFALFLAVLPLFKGRGRVAYVTLCSYAFYSWWYPPYLPLLLMMTALAHIGAILMERRHIPLSAMIAVTLAPLVLVKYWAFAANTVLALAGSSDASYVLEWKLPLGLSFITFTIIAYLVEVHRGRYPLERRVEHTALYIAFFPHLIAGPILRPRELMAKLMGIAYTHANLVFALMLFAVGMVKKAVFADQIASVVDSVYRQTEPLNLGQSLVAFYGFSVQIYCDFSGYSDMALALAAIIGIRFPRNFQQPYRATSLRDFWKRWHISLSRWLRDYLYKPLGGSRHGLGRMVAAVLVTMILGGLWHGASWTFALWGLIHGLLIAGEHVLSSMKLLPLRIPGWIKVVVTLHLVSFAWVLFRSSDLGVAGRIFNGFAHPDGSLGFISSVAWPCALTVLAIAVHRFDSVARIKLMSQRLPAPIAITMSVAAVLIAAVLVIDNPNAFIYFDF